jgi:outer membrane immunogenic protein
MLAVTVLWLAAGLSPAAEAQGGGAQGSSSCSSGPFAGAYIGANAGGGQFDADQTTNGLEVGGSGETFTGGADAGYNFQCDQILFGIETDFNYLDVGADARFPGPIFANARLDWFGTVRGRLGLVFDDRLLVYATGGLAYAAADHILTDPAFNFRQSDDNVRIGWVAGGGIEWLRHGPWSLRAEGLFVDLGSERHYYVVTACGVTCQSRTDWDDSFWVVRLGLNYRFGKPEPAPLK